MFTRLQAKIRYLVDNAFARKFVGQFLLFFSLVIPVTLLGTTAMFFGLFSEQNAAISSIPRDVDAGFLDSVWWSLNQVVRLPGFHRAYGATLPVVLYSLFLSLMGLVVFSVLISLINNTMRSRIEELRKGDTPVLERNHLLILGWNNKILSILQQLARLQPGIKVVILAPRAIDDMQEQLRVAGIQRERVKIILRSGTPSDHGELDRVAVDRADSVIVLATDSDDSEVIKTMVLLTSRKQWPGEPPVLTAEIARSDNFELASIAARNRIHVISSSQIISKVLVQTIRNPGLSNVYSELFSPSGNGIVVQFLAESIDRPMAEIAYSLSAAIPLGIAWDQTRDGVVRHLAGLNPEPDYEVAEDERLVLLTRSPTVSYAQSGKIPESRIYQDRASVVPHVPAQVLLIGWIDNLGGLLKELDAHALHGTEVTIISRSIDKQTQQQPVNSQAGDFSNLTLVKHEGDPASETTYEDLDIASFQSIVVLADESDQDQDADTRSLRILLRLSDLLDRSATKIHTVVEILDENNRTLFSGLDVDDIVVSSEVVAAQLAQIAHRDVLAPIYRELLSAGGVEISLRPVGDYVALDTDCQFADLLYAGHQRMEITLGLLLARDGRVLLNPSRNVSWRLGLDDKVIVLAQQVYQ